MQDSYNLAWKLAHSLFGLCPDSTALLRTYETERRMWAERVVFFDKRWNQEGVPLEQMYAEMAGQVTGTGIEEAPNWVNPNDSNQKDNAVDKKRGEKNNHQ